MLTLIYFWEDLNSDSCYVEIPIKNNSSIQIQDNLLVLSDQYLYEKIREEEIEEFEKDDLLIFDEEFQAYGKMRSKVFIRISDLSDFN